VIRRLFQRGVTFRLGAREIQAASAPSLRAALAGHAPVSMARMAELGALSDRALRARATALDDLGARVGASLAGGQAQLHPLLAQLHAGGVPLDRPWSEILATARHWTPARSDYQRAVLEALLEHLRGERDCVRTLLANRGRAAMSGPGGGGEPGAGPRQQLLYEPALLAGQARAPTQFIRLTKGDPLEIPMARGQALELMLAHHRFLVVCGSPWLLVDETGEDLRLGGGRNVVGRSVDCETIVHRSLRAVSRRHAIFEVEGTARLSITDMSSFGTFVPVDDPRRRLH
jgi:hypothetical protein